MDSSIHFLNEELHWFLVKRTLIDGGVYMRFKRVKDRSLLLCSQLCFGYWYWYVGGLGKYSLYSVFLLVWVVSKDSRGH